ncbi:MAG: hypothetical protein CVV64_07900 [Candidatus Wallbacteria bacterium HGW-Wallbacteria-1]|uniref:HEAT repeat domain-containing protein n=1 Tax=Candidatus Wallbacteria bacterium HGW-Wallbacteria-1 TaxID=2013854 RepID=A0A2N1PR95_9BACT|nr:MAG: hypothetical protein CVV64_07900 [Candidatus Wallbacteria bacterium HGW-Wallbacteria-1]
MNPEVSLLLEQLESDDTRSVRVALERLGRLGDPEALPMLREMLSHPDDMVSFFAKRAISKIEAASGTVQVSPSVSTPASTPAPTPAPAPVSASEPAQLPTNLQPKPQPALQSSESASAESVNLPLAQIPVISQTPSVAPILNKPSAPVPVQRVTVENLDVASLIQDDLDNPFERLLETGPWDMQSGDDLLDGIMDGGADDSAVEIVDDDVSGGSSVSVIPERAQPSGPRRRQIYDPWAGEESDDDVTEVSSSVPDSKNYSDSEQNSLKSGSVADLSGDAVFDMISDSGSNVPEIEILSDSPDDDGIYDISSSAGSDLTGLIGSGDESADEDYYSAESEIDETGEDVSEGDSNQSVFGIPTQGPFAELVKTDSAQQIIGNDSESSRPRPAPVENSSSGMPEWWKPEGETQNDDDADYSGKPYVPSYGRGRRKD